MRDGLVSFMVGLPRLFADVKKFAQMLVVDHPPYWLSEACWVNPPAHPRIVLESASRYWSLWQSAASAVAITRPLIEEDEEAGRRHGRWWLLRTAARRGSKLLFGANLRRDD